MSRIDRVVDLLLDQRILGLRRLAGTLGRKTWPAGLVLVGWLLWPAPRPWPVSLVAGAAAAIGAAYWLRALALLAAYHVLTTLEDRAGWRHRYGNYTPPRTETGAIAWDTLGDYMAVAEVEGFARLSSLPAILDGPLRRYFDLCEETAHARPLSARTMEFARGTVRSFCRRRPWLARRAERMVRAELERRFRARHPWLIAVYEGRLNHHATRLPEEEEAAFTITGTDPR